jgi:hypothetical protein
MPTSDARARSGRHGLIAAGWWVLIVCVTLNGVIVGLGAVTFVFFGAAQRSDFLVSAGGYGAAATVLVFAVVGVAGLNGPVWAGRTAAVAAVLLAALAASSAMTAATMADDGGWNGPLDGVGGVVLVPFAWPLIIAGLRGGYRLLRGTARVRPGTLDRVARDDRAGRH